MKSSSLRKVPQVNIKHVCSGKKYILFLFFNCFLGISIASADSFISAVSPDYPKGFHVKIIKYISRELEVDVEFLYAPLGRRVRMLSIGQLDLLVGLRKTPEREEHFIFIKPFYRLGKPSSGFYINTQTKNFIDKNATSRIKLIAMATGSTYIQDYKLEFPYEVIQVVSLVQGIELLKKGRVDAFIYGKKAADIELNKMNLHYIKPSLMITPTADKNNASYIAISKSSKLVNHINKLSQISSNLLNGKFKELYDSHYK
ncbi:MAG: transporter substrate-binding domain-containing protein [Colwellia sp.]|nr:transporter substrate-binding domain-containing protein [Colwellia sp.]